MFRLLNGIDSKAKLQDINVKILNIGFKLTCETHLTSQLTTELAVILDDCLNPL